MKVDGRHFRSIWLEDDGWTVGAIDQRRLPHEFVMTRIASAEDATEAIGSMLVVIETEGAGNADGGGAPQTSATAAEAPAPKAPEVEQRIAAENSDAGDADAGVVQPVQLAQLHQPRRCLHVGHAKVVADIFEVQ